MYYDTLEWTVHVLSDILMDSACTVILWYGQSMFCQTLEWIVHVLSAFGMDSACTVRLWTGQCL